MKPVLRPALLIALLALAACATPLQQCLSDAGAPFSAALREQARITKDLARGYTFETRFEEVRRSRICRIAGGGFYPCSETDMQPVTRRVPVDAGALTARLDEISAQLPALRQAATSDAAQCRALYPEAEDAG